jgi:autotransporter-associated beta strand protein
VRLTASNQIANAAAVTVLGSGLLDLNGFNEQIGSLTMTGGNVQTGVGSLTPGNVTTNASSGAATITGNLSLGVTSRTFTVANGTAANDLVLNATISSPTSVNLTKEGAGTMVFGGTAANSFLGATLVNAGTLVLSKPAGTLATPGSLSVADGAEARLTASNQMSDAASVSVDGLLNLNGFSETINFLTLTGGTVQTGAGRSPRAMSAANASAETSLIQGNLSLGSVTRTVTVADGAAATDLEIVAAIRPRSRIA